MFRKAVFLLCTFLCLRNDNFAHGFFGKMMNRLQRQWMESWQQMRDQQILPRRIAEMRLGVKPSYIQTIDGFDGKLDIAVSGLNTSSHSFSLYRIRNVTDWLVRQEHFTLEPMATDLGEINSIARVDPELLVTSGTTYWSTASNFYKYPRAPLVEGKISLVPAESIQIGNMSQQQRPVTITSDEDKTHWFYSKMEWVDMNQDGWPDIVTSRMRGRPDSIQVSELVWLENPNYAFFFHNEPRHWRTHPITHGPDTAIQVLRIPLPSGESRLVIIGAGYWDNKLYAVWTEDPREDWSNVDAIKERVIDNHGWFFDIRVADVNADGRVDVIASTWAHGVRTGAVFVYEIPCDFIRGKWKKHTLIDGAANMDLVETGSGAKINVFHPHLRYGQATRTKKPFILVSDDDAGRVQVLIPNSRKTNNWQYTSHTIYRARGPVGEVSIDDMNHDGYMEIVIPVMDSMKLVIFSYEPGPMGPEYFVDES